MCKSGIYKITNIVDNKVYIGQSVDVETRIKRHKSDLKNKKHRNSLLQRAYDKYGKFKYEIIEHCEIAMMDDKEVYWIAYHKSTNRDYGYNFESGGNINKIMHEETKDKIRESNKGSSDLLTEDNVREIKMAIHLGIAQTELVELFNVSDSTISKIAKGVNWYWVLPQFNNSHEHHYINAKKDRKNKILELWNKRLSYRDIEKMTPYSYAEISNVLRGLSTKKKNDRYKDIKNDYENGLSKKEILTKYNISTSVFESALPNVHFQERKELHNTIFTLHNSGLSNREISEKLNIHRTTVTDHLKGRFSVERKQKLLTDELKKEILLLHSKGLSRNAIALRLKIGNFNVTKTLKNAGINSDPISIKVVQLTLNGELIKTWNSANEASLELGISASSITSNCKGKRRTAGEYFWMYFDDYNKGVKFNIKPFKKTVIQLSKDFDYIKEWSSVSDASRFLNVETGNISSVCNGKRKTTGGYKWMYKDDYEKYIEEQNKLA